MRNQTKSIAVITSDETRSKSKNVSPDTSQPGSGAFLLPVADFVAVLDAGNFDIAGGTVKIIRQVLRFNVLV